MDSTQVPLPSEYVDAFPTVAPMRLDDATPLEGERAMPEELRRFWTAIRRLPRYARLASGLARTADVPPAVKAALASAAVYAISPVDLIPGFIPIAGQLDDMVVVLLAVKIALRSCPAEVAQEQLLRAGLLSSDLDDDLAACRDVATWVLGRGLRAGQSALRWASRRALAAGRSVQAMIEARAG